MKALVFSERPGHHGVTSSLSGAVSLGAESDFSDGPVTCVDTPGARHDLNDLNIVTLSPRNGKWQSLESSITDYLN